jgi:hypothetical protein
MPLRKTKEVELTQVESQKNHASGALQSAVAYQVIAADSQLADLLSIEIIARR